MKKKAFGHYRSLLVENSRFRNLWLGQTVSYTGNSIYDIALMWFVFEQTGSSVQVALILVAGFLPEVLVGMFFGALADRWNRKRLMQVADLVQAGVLGLLALSFYFDTFHMWQLYAVTILLSLASLLFSIANGAWLPELVAKEQLLTANSLFSTSRQITRLVGSALGGILVAMVGATTAIAFDAVTFLVSFAFLQMISYQPVVRNESSSHAEKSLVQDIGEGIRWLLGQRVLVMLVLIGTLSNVALGPTNVLPAMYIKTDLQADAYALGIFDAAIGLGLLVGGIVMGMLSPKKVGLWFVAGLGLEGGGMLVVSVAPSLEVACVGNFLLGFAVMMAALPMGTLLQVLTPSGMRGRVNSIMSLGLNLSIPITYGGVGMLAGELGSRVSYALGGGLLVACLVIGLASSQVRQSDLSVPAPSQAHSA